MGDMTTIRLCMSFVQKSVFFNNLSTRKHNVKSITCRANVLYTTTFLCRSSTLTICHDVADIDMTTTTRRRRHVVAAQKHENWMPKCQHLAHTCSSLERFYAVNVGDMSCRVVADVDMATRTCRRRVKKTTRRANTADKTTTVSAENALKYIDFNTKHVIKTPCGRAERLPKKDMFPRRNHVVHCTKTWKLNAEMATCRTNVLCTTAFLRRQRRRDIMPSAMSRWRWRHIEDVTSSSSSRRRRVKKDNTSRNDYWQNDSLFAEIVDLFILLTSLHSTTFKTEVST